MKGYGYGCRSYDKYNKALNILFLHMYLAEAHNVLCEHVTFSEEPKHPKPKLTAESNTNLFSGDLLLTTVLALHWEFLANLIMRLKWIPENSLHQTCREYLILHI